MTEIATFGAGCFWGVQQLFDELEGVIQTEVGYMGGSLDQPGYRDVCTGRTGHAEVVQVTFSPDVVTYDELVHYFWRLHDPTQLNRQGPDHGTQYRSVIFTHSDYQEKAARRAKEDMDTSGRYQRPIATEISQASTFWRGEEYHQKYFEKQGGGQGCHILHW